MPPKNLDDGVDLQTCQAFFRQWKKYMEGSRADMLCYPDVVVSLLMLTGKTLHP